MLITKTELEGCVILKPTIFRDERGYFFESFNKTTFKKHIGLDLNFVQDNESKSSKGVLRGLHFQRGEHAQAKLIRVVKGKILDVVVDVRPSSPTYGKHLSIILSAKNKKQLYMPPGFAHGFVTLSKQAVVNYKCDNYYNKDSEGGIIFNDTTLNINWVLDHKKLIISKKDLSLPSFNNI
ncbi:dTDP-4-dehydrorhamnose 3,5-epimerase [Winogradskyella alexanderae]|uniref:dTDP-4-dehydrorhamnose 3,5-epimerase n=1 Tax=Winogradskyella alexanderae TaxID=2877123 RepID=A0ABS7XP98_9FLAO|nr:dTDP-4-dehydrorhamnose 3,5-epimerase [Winogradskyella alexanderae]MCA0131288.1 dTDP-4-dehydrorhamnose 3,5-epimerase [Winogradskyella alexanderae]